MKTEILVASVALSAVLGSGYWIALRNDRERNVPREKPAQLTADGTLVQRGRAFFPIGIYQVSHTDAEYAMLAGHGFNAVQGNFTTDVAHFIETLDLAQRHNLAVAVPLDAENLIKENLPQSLAKIRAAAGHPAVLSWKICDEPDAEMWARLRREVPPAYEAIKSLNPGQPIELTLSKDSALRRWTRFCDMVEIDRYPVPGKPLTQVLDFCVRTRKEMKPWQNLTCVVQCGWTKDLATQPSFAQARSMVYLALIGGAKGIFWYSFREKDGWNLTTTPLWPRLKQINGEIAALATPMMLGSGVTGIACNATDVRFTARRHLDKLYLLATNPGTAPADAVFSLPADIRATAARLAGDGRNVPLEGQTVRIPFGGIDSVTIVFDL